MLGLLLSLLGCDNNIADTAALAEPAVEPIVENPPPEGWVLDPSLQCDNPAEPTWYDIGPTTTTSLPEDSFMIDVEPGAIALLEENGEYLLFHSPPFEPAQAIDPLTGAVVIPDLGYSVGGYNVGDLNNDGELDLIVGGNYSVIVYSVMSDNRVIEDPPWLVECIMEQTGCFFRRMPREMVIGDFNLDGLNDVFVGFTNATGTPVSDLRHEMFWGSSDGIWKKEILSYANSSIGQLFDITPVDWSEDGDIDLYLCHDTPQFQWRNAMLLNNGEGKMMHAMLDGVNISVDCMGSDFADVDADSDLDLIIGDSQRLILLEQIQGSYIDVSFSKGLTPYANIDMAWAVLGADFDNDGSMELLSSNSEFWTDLAGATHTLFDFTLNELGQYEVKNRFSDVSATRALIAQDLNKDGVLDLIAGDSHRAPWIFLSDSCSDQSWLDVQAPPYTTVRVESDGIERVAYASYDSSYTAMGPSVVHFGLGAATQVDRITLTLLGGERVVYEGPLLPNRRVSWYPSINQD